MTYSTGRTTSTLAYDRYIKKHYLSMPVKRIANNINKSNTFVKSRIIKLGLIIPPEIIAQRKMDSRIKPGSIPANKGRKQSEYMSKEGIERTKATQFKSGNLPHNTADKNGTIRIRFKHPNRNNGKSYKYIRLSLGNWVPLHVHKWQNKNGPIPAGMCLWFKDGNSLNCNLRNLKLISRAENLRRNREEFLQLPKELQTTKKLIKKLNNTIHGKEQTKRSK